MLADLRSRLNPGSALDPMAFFLRRPVRLIRDYDRKNLRPDLIAGVTVAVILLPQAIAFAIIADLPPKMGLYSAIMGAVFGALWGSSDQVHTGPTNAISLLVLSSLQGTGITDSGQLILAAGLMAVMVGLFQLFMGLARLGILINFVSHSVVVGFATGAGVLIAIKQLSPLTGIAVSGHNILETTLDLLGSLGASHGPTAALGVGTIIFIFVLRAISPRLPGALLSMIVSSLVVFVAQLDEAGVVVIGQLPSEFPPLANLPLLDLELVGRLSAGALAVGAIGLVETMAIARSVSAQTGQRLDSNQEFVGQGLANITAGLFSGYATAGSFSRTAVNFRSGAKSPLAALFSSAFVLIALFTMGPLAAYLPRTALAGVLIVTAYTMIDGAEIRRIWFGARGDAAIMLITFLGTLFLEIEFAVLAGILFSFARYIMRTSAPRVHVVVPDADFKHFAYQPEKAACPQLRVTDILGDLYFGAVNHVEEALLNLAEQKPEQRFVLIRMIHVNHCDFSGIHMLENVVRSQREQGGDVFVVRAGYNVRKVMASTGFDEYLDEDHFLPEDEAISHIFHHVLDPAICIYECPLRVFKECQNLPKRVDVVNIPPHAESMAERFAHASPQELWSLLHDNEGTVQPYLIDVREPREYRRGHVPEASSVPLPRILSDDVKLPNDRPTVLICRSGRRSRRAAYALQRIGCTNVMILRGGMLAWEAAGLLEAIE